MFQPPLLLPAHADLPAYAAVLVVLLPAHAAPAIPPVPAVLLATSSCSSRSRHMLQPLSILPAHADPPVSTAVLATGPRSSCYSFCYSCYCYCYCAPAAARFFRVLDFCVLPAPARGRKSQKTTWLPESCRDSGSHVSKNSN